MPVYWSKITTEHSVVPVLDIGVFNYHEFMARCMMTVTSTAPRSFAKAIMQPAWHPAFIKEISNFIDNTCFQWIKDRSTQDDEDMVVLNQGRHDHEG